jgi:signal peptidase I
VKAVAARKTEENFRKTSSSVWKRLTGGWIGTVFYVFLGIGMALLAKQALVFGLSTDMPVVAVISPSMQHDNAQQTYFGWLENTLGYNESYVKSWSMPTGFLVGDMPVVQGADEYEVGDIIVYKVEGQSFPTIHRIIKINADSTYQTKGDNNSHQLPYEFSVEKEQIYGKVVFVVPKLGYVKVFFTNLFGV